MADGTEHVEELLGLYYLDELDVASAHRVRAHLDACGTCRDEAAKVCEALAAMALLLDDREGLASMYGALGTSVPPAFPARFAPIEEREEPRSRIGWPPRSRRSGRSRPTESAALTDAPAPEPPPPAPTTRTAVAPAKETSAPTVPPAVPNAAPTVPPAGPTVPPAAPPAKPAAPAGRAVPAAAPAAPAAAPALPAVSLTAPTVAPMVSTVAPVVAAADPAATPVLPTIAPGVRTKPVKRPAPSTVPAPMPLTTQPAGQTRPVRHTGSLIVSIGLLAATVTLGGTTATMLLREHDGEPSTPTARAAVSAAASTTDVDSGVRMTVTLTAKDGSTEVRAKLTGLTRGTGYRLYGYGPDDNRWAVVNWTGGAGKEQEVSGTVPAAIAGISHVTVLRSDRKTVVTVYFSHDTEAEIGPNGG
ncbi:MULTISPECIES: zf-HC2 domain-containing protein [Micromonospora]|uniref:zf-HC2 domain-containing protein n=1 Tax=Micromonospora TaxID=1873 RepID=UPI001B38A421|nr:zf-HC2 domain-containing protein [Micromonospora sp. C81]MBQ1038674.1 zf-HC2 domain-containing protein [Micromonospora sp. C81]WTI22338.1 zf-HC2 domain-containing protein [Micromonospora zamorensis]